MYIRFRSWMAPVVVGVLLAGCGAIPTGLGGGTATPAAVETAAPVAGVAVKCPAVQIQPDTQGVTRYAGGREGDAMAVRHQLSITRTARDCRFVDGTLFLRVGVAGRIVLGPAGGPGTFSEPVRFVVARGGVEPVYSQTRTVQVSVPSGATSAEFDIVDADIQVQVRADETVNNFQIFVGFDT